MIVLSPIFPTHGIMNWLGDHVTNGAEACQVRIAGGGIRWCLAISTVRPTAASADVELVSRSGMQAAIKSGVRLTLRDAKRNAMLAKELHNLIQCLTCSHRASG